MSRCLVLRTRTLPIRWMGNLRQPSAPGWKRLVPFSGNALFLMDSMQMQPCPPGISASFAHSMRRDKNCWRWWSTNWECRLAATAGFSKSPGRLPIWPERSISVKCIWLKRFSIGDWIGSWSEETKLLAERLGLNDPLFRICIAGVLLNDYPSAG